MRATGFETRTIPPLITPMTAFLIIFIIIRSMAIIIFIIYILLLFLIHLIISFNYLFKFSFIWKNKKSRHTHPLVVLVVSNPNRVFSGLRYPDKADS